jgi:hypothetical protein
MDGMDFGIKISKRGYDVTDKKGKKNNMGKGATPQRVDAYLLYSFAIPYLMGAWVTVQRYKQVAATLKETPVKGVQSCLHEASTLFEDLATISKYAEMCGDTHERHQLWIDVRNHIRHDTREEFDKDKNWKHVRAERLGLDDRLQTNIGFNETAIKVGSVEILISEIEEYMKWATVLFNDTMNEARAKGYIKESEWHPDIMNS